MLEELNRAGQHLRTALDQYLSVCTFIRDSCLGGSLRTNDELFYNCLESEANQFPGHKTKFEEAQVAINVIRNTRPATYINSLPPEILIRIFSVLFNKKYCLIDHQYPHPPSISAGRNHVLYPDTLSRVCSSWRRLVTSIPHFWRHIDIVLNHPLNPGLVTCAGACIARAGEVPLEIHICNPCFSRTLESTGLISAPPSNQPSNSRATSAHDPNTLHNFQFLLSSPALIKSLCIYFHINHGLQDFLVAVLEYFLGKCTPELLDCFSMQEYNYDLDYAEFLEPADKPRFRSSRLLAIPSQHLENVWLSTTILRLNGSCPPWSSNAYHGLVELRLGDRVPAICESELVGILRLNPRLRVLHINTSPENTTPHAHSVEPVRLDDLEELEIDQQSGQLGMFGDFLRWIAPGSKPLQLHFCGEPDYVGPTQFCARANITRFFIQDFGSGSFVDMIRRSPWLDTLAISAVGEGIIDLNSILTPVDPSYLDGLGPTTQIDTLYLRNLTDISFEDIQSAINEYSIKHLIIRGTSISYGAAQGLKVIHDPQEIKAKLSTLRPLPMVECPTGRCPLDLECGWN